MDATDIKFQIIQIPDHTACLSQWRNGDAYFGSSWVILCSPILSPIIMNQDKDDLAGEVMTKQLWSTSQKDGIKVLLEGAYAKQDWVDT